MAASEHAVTLITRSGCHLCEQAEHLLRSMAGELGFRYTELDVDADPVLKAEHSDDVPVIMLDGRQHGYWRVEEQRLRRDLAR
jgi:glutaredoxin